MKFTTVALIALAASQVLAADVLSDAVHNVIAVGPANGKDHSATLPPRTPGPVSFVVGQNITIQPGDVKLFDQVPYDLSGADTVAISVFSASSLSYMTLGVSWAPYSSPFCLTSLIFGSDFVLDKTDGGRQLPVFGPNMSIVIQNAGTTSIVIKQLTIYTVVH